MNMINILELAKMTGDQKKEVLMRSHIDFEEMSSVVGPIIKMVQSGGDNALLKLAEQYDKCRLSQLAVSRDEMDAAALLVDEGIKEALRHIHKNSISYYQKELPLDWNTWLEDGILSGAMYKPYNRVGVYVPGGKGSFPAMVLRLSTPVCLAGVKEVVICTPPLEDGSINPAILYAAKLNNINTVYKVGGAQAIAAMAYGTETVKKVEKIVGVGSSYVTAAQKILFGEVAVDRLAGPSDALILADSSAVPEYVAADMLIESEHSPNSGSPVLIDNMESAIKIKKYAEQYITEAPERQKNIFETSLLKYSPIIVYQTMEEAVNFINDYAPEHLHVQIKNPYDLLKSIKNTGAVQIGSYSVISSTDFFGGSANALPTGGYAKIFGDVSVLDFFKKIPIQYVNLKGFKHISKKAVHLAEYQDMYFHAKAIKVRKEFEIESV